jgi:hypothetical protein
MMVGDVGEGPTSYGEVLRTREDTIAELGADKPRLDSTTQAALNDSRGESRVLSGRSGVEGFIYMGFVAHRSWREEEERVSAGMTAFARFKKRPK